MRYKTQEICIKSVDISPFVFNSVPDRYNAQEMCDKAVSKNTFLLKYCLDRYKSQETFDKAIDDFTTALKFAPHWSVASKMIKKLHNAFFTDDDILFFHKDSGNVAFFSNKMSILHINLNNINLDDGNFDEDDLEIIIHVGLMALRNTLKQR